LSFGSRKARVLIAISIAACAAYAGITCGLGRPPLEPHAPVVAARLPLGPDARAAGCVEDEAPDAAVAPSAAASDRLPTHFAGIGDYGDGGANEQRVAVLVKSWRPDFVITMGDNNYPNGGKDTIDANIGQFYRQFIFPYVGGYGCGAKENRFFPSLGNHDWITTGARPYLDYFELPGNERYYDFVRGDVHLFALDSDVNEPDGTNADSIQARWLRGRLAASTARWQIVYMHHAPFSSGPHGSTARMQWPYKAWGADLVLAGHDHTYERIERDGLTYIVAGLSGRGPYDFNAIASGSKMRFNQGHGAALIDADATRLRVRFFTADGALLDDITLGSAPP
jgi:tartrate-resistant acid phosphatase type 5